MKQEEIDKIKQETINDVFVFLSNYRFRYTNGKVINWEDIKTNYKASLN